MLWIQRLWWLHRVPFRKYEIELSHAMLWERSKNIFQSKMYKRRSWEQGTASLWQKTQQKDYEYIFSQNSFIPFTECEGLCSCAVGWKYTCVCTFVLSDRHSRGNNTWPLKYKNFYQLERQTFFVFWNEFWVMHLVIYISSDVSHRVFWESIIDSVTAVSFPWKHHTQNNNQFMMMNIYNFTSNPVFQIVALYVSLKAYRCIKRLPDLPDPFGNNLW